MIKKRLQVMAAGVWVAFLVCQANAQTNTAPGSTNVGLVVNISLTGFKEDSQSKATPVRVTTKDVLAALNSSGGFNFDKAARLIFLSNEDQEPTVWVQEGTGANAPLVNINNFFSVSQPDEVDANQGLTSYAIRIFSFDDGHGTTFNVSGLTTMRRRPIRSPNVGPLLRVASAQAQVAGQGTMNGAAVVLRGTINGGSPEVLANQD